MLKKTLLIISFISVVLFVGMAYIQQTCDYNAHGLCWRYWNLTGDILENAVIVIPFFIFSLIIYKFRDEIFQTWFWFTVLAVPISIVLPLISSARGGGLSGMFPSMREVLQYSLPVLYAAVSLGIIIWNTLYIQNKKRR